MLSGGARTGGGVPAELADRFWNRLRFAAMRRVRDAARAEAIARQALESVAGSDDRVRVENDTPLAARLLEAARAGSAGTAAPGDGDGDALRGLVSEERREEVAQLLATLDGSARDVLAMSLRDGLEGAELARRLGAGAEEAARRRDAALAHVAECIGLDFGPACAAAFDPDLPSRYCRGRSTPEEADAFEAHYFTCNRCWARLVAGNAARTALLGAKPERSLTGPATPERGPRLLLLFTLLTAALLLLWQLVCRTE